MILAAPLVIPFAEAVGISIATLGMAKAADMVNDYIQENPEQSIKILSTIVPGVGIGEIFMKKGKDEEVEEEVEVEDVDARDLTRAEKAKMMKELAKSGGGNMREKMKKGYEEIIQPGESDRELDDAEDRYDGGLEEVSKPKFDYKKFFKKRYADGGAIGIEVLFEEKKPRKNFNTGGTPYDARATTQDFTNALDKVGAGTDLQKAVAIGEYGQNARRQNPFKNLGFLNTQRHFDNNQLLKNAVTRGQLSSADYNRLGGFDVAQTMGAGNPVLGGIGNLIGSTGYNIVQSLKGNQSPFDIPGDVFRNVQGGTGLISDDLKTQYESIINSSTPTYDSRSAGAIITDGDSKYRINTDGSRSLIGKIGDAPIIDRPTMADVAGPGTSNNLLSLFERYKDIQTPAGADPNNPDFVGETALGNIEKGVKGFLTSDIGLKYGKDIPSDINDIYSSIEAQRRAFSPDLSQNYQGGDLYYYLQNFYKDKYGLKEGGRVGLFMGGPPLTGQALQTYNSMKAYGFSDQEIADALSLQRASASNAETATAATAAPINIYNQLGGGGNGPDDDDDGPTSNAGLKGFDAVRTAGLFALNPVGYLASKALTGLYNNYKNPYTNVLGVTNAATKAAITREETRDLQDRIDRGDFGSNTPTPQDKGRTDKGGKGSGSSDGSKGSRGGGMGGFGGGADRD